MRQNRKQTTTTKNSLFQIPEEKNESMNQGSSVEERDVADWKGI
jgi:hypothetical protein